MENVQSEEYISIGTNRHIEKVISVSDPDTIMLSGNNWNGDKYIRAGLSGNENEGTWTDGNEMTFFKLNFTGEGEQYVMIINVETAYKRDQRVIAYVNDQMVKDIIVDANMPSIIQIPIILDENRNAKIRLSLPNVVAPIQTGLNSERRTLGLRRTSISFQKSD